MEPNLMLNEVRLQVAAEMGRKGGKARWRGKSENQRKQIMSKVAKARWKKGGK